MTLVLDSGALSALSAHRRRSGKLRLHRMWPAEVLAVVLTESLTGDHRRDFQVERLLKTCRVFGVDESLARHAARLRARTGRAASISAVDAIVAAFAQSRPQPVVLTSDPDAMRLLAEHADPPFEIALV